MLTVGGAPPRARAGFGSKPKQCLPGVGRENLTTHYAGTSPRATGGGNKVGAAHH